MCLRNSSLQQFPQSVTVNGYHVKHVKAPPWLRQARRKVPLYGENVVQWHHFVTKRKMQENANEKNMKKQVSYVFMIERCWKSEHVWTWSCLLFLLFSCSLHWPGSGGKSVQHGWSTLDCTSSPVRDAFRWSSFQNVINGLIKSIKILYRRVQAQPTPAWCRPSPILPATSPFLNSSNSSMMPNLNRPRPKTSHSNRTVFGWSSLMPKEKWQKWGLLQLYQQLPELLQLQLLLLLLENDAVQPRTILTHRCTNVPKHTRCHSWVPDISPIGTVRLGRHVIRKTSTALTSSFRELNSTSDSNIALRQVIEPFSSNVRFVLARAPKDFSWSKCCLLDQSMIYITTCQRVVFSCLFFTQKKQTVEPVRMKMWTLPRCWIKDPKTRSFRISWALERRGELHL